MQLIRPGFVGAMLMSLSCVAHAHLVPAQSGTVNFTDTGAFVVVSLPVSSFPGIDDNDDGKLSITEFDRHRPAISNSIKERFFVSDAQQVYRLAGMMLSLSLAHNAVDQSSTQIVALGRIKMPVPHLKLTIHANLFGHADSEKTLRLRVSRNKKNYRKLTLTPTQPTRSLTFKLYGAISFDDRMKMPTKYLSVPKNFRD